MFVEFLPPVGGSREQRPRGGCREARVPGCGRSRGPAGPSGPGAQAAQAAQAHGAGPPRPRLAASPAPARDGAAGPLGSRRHLPLVSCSHCPGLVPRRGRARPCAAWPGGDSAAAPPLPRASSSSSPSPAGRWRHQEMVRA